MSYAEQLIGRDRSVIVAADVEAEKLAELVRATCVVKGIGGYKVGLELVLEQGLPKVVKMVEDNTDLPIIYDHQKAGNDIPEMGVRFASVCKKAGVDAVILFPFSSARTERDWIHACQDKLLTVLVGGHMTQPEFLENEGGFIAVGAPDRIYQIAAENGVRDFVVPGNKVEYVAHYREFLERMLGKGTFNLYAPGFITQKGEISEFAQVAGEKWHAIVGSAIYKAMDIRAAAEQMTSQIR
jgi:orotidine-5'-phosphate decarboxylase